MTVHDHLLAIGADDREARNAEELLARVVPLGRPIVLTDEVVAAARAGDSALVATLLAAEVDPDSDEVAALEEARVLDDGSRATLDDVRSELGIS
ncbi:MAG: hypothetical protein JOZ86_02275 [Candidatus Eremiobacteraeota bacterium]|nr:hypothetical protein [Candidatus Eremiobacteraeota bacterium]